MTITPTPKGHHSLQIDGTAWTLALDYRALVQIEQAFERSIWEVLRQSLVEGDYWFTDLSIIFRALLRAGGHEELSVDEAGELMFAAGLRTSLITIANVFRDAFGDVLDGSTESNLADAGLDLAKMTLAGGRA